MLRTVLGSAVWELWTQNPNPCSNTTHHSQRELLRQVLGSSHVNKDNNTELARSLSESDRTNKEHHGPHMDEAYNQTQSAAMQTASKTHPG